MVFLFYFSGIIAALSTLCVILHNRPMHALLYLILSFLSVSCVFFSLGASFAAAIEVIVYAGAIMILFVFVVMMLNTENIISGISSECDYLNVKLCFGVVLLASVLCVIILFVVSEMKNYFICVPILAADIYHIGYKLFGFYMLVVEMASFVLLSALVSVLHISQQYKYIAYMSHDPLRNKI